MSASRRSASLVCARVRDARCCALADIETRSRQMVRKVFIFEFGNTTAVCLALGTYDGLARTVKFRSYRCQGFAGKTATRGAGDGIKPGVERSETPGTNARKFVKSATRATDSKQCYTFRNAG